MTRNCSREDSDFTLESVLCNRVIDNWNSLSPRCINYNTKLTLFKKCLSPGMESGTVQSLVSHL